MTYFQRLRGSEGHSIDEAAREAAEKRLRPCLMTTLVAMIGLFPAAVSNGIGAQTQKPLAIVVIGGALDARGGRPDDPTAAAGRRPHRWLRKARRALWRGSRRRHSWSRRTSSRCDKLLEPWLTRNPSTRILIANRGEIARRVIRTCRRLGIGYGRRVFGGRIATPRTSRDADEAMLVGPSPAKESYLNIETILDAVRKTGAQAVHPGYGFLSERPAFARAVAAAGAVFVGPPPEVLGSCSATR